MTKSPPRAGSAAASWPGEKESRKRCQSRAVHPSKRTSAVSTRRTIAVSRAFATDREGDRPVSIEKADEFARRSGSSLAPRAFMSARSRTTLSRRPFPYALAVVCAGVAFAGCSGAPAREESVGTASAALTGNDKTAFDFFVGKGLTSYQAAGIVGNLDQESGDRTRPSVQYGGGPGRGIAQWSAGGRWDTDANDNVDVVRRHSRASRRRRSTLQLEFIWYELTTFSGYGLSRASGERRT